MSPPCPGVLRKGCKPGQAAGDPPTDGITALRFSANSDLLLCASWDGVGATRQGPCHACQC